MQTEYHHLEDEITTAFNNRSELSPTTVSSDTLNAVNTVLDLLDQGKIRVAEKINGSWHTHTWIKQAILISFRIFNNELIDGHYAQFYDKLPLKFVDETTATQNIRIVPHAIARKGAYFAPNCILMPSYTNIGAYVDSGTLIDTWATIGSCAQIGKNVHISGGVGIGGVLEPLQANPTIIEDNCFIGARSEIVEGVIVEEDSVIGMGVFLGQSTRILNRMTGEVTYGRIPAGSVVVSGSIPAQDGSHSLYCAVIVKKVDAKTRAKTSLNELLRI